MKGERVIAGIGCFCWVAGFIVFMVGMNLEGATKEWMSVAGSIVFFIVLLIVGIIWAKKRYIDEDGEGKEEEGGMPSDEAGK